MHQRHPGLPLQFDTGTHCPRSLHILCLLHPLGYNYVFSSSQFYNKVKAHEERHYEQFTAGVEGIPVNELWDANNLYNNTLSTMTSTISEADLIQLIEVTVLNKNDQDNETHASLWFLMEHDAKRISDEVEPDYLE